MNTQEEQGWQTLRTHFAALRHVNEQAKADVPGSEYDIPSTLSRLNEKCHRLGDCETRISDALTNHSALTWWAQRQLLGKRCREVYTWFDRSTDDNFDWTQQAQAIRTARDEVARCLGALGF